MFANPDSSEATLLLEVSLTEAELEIARRDTNEPYLVVVRKEWSWMVSSSSLTILTTMLQMSFHFVNVMSVGNLGANELASMSLAMTIMGVLAIAPAFGLLAAMDTFCSNSYTASHDKTMVGFHFQRGLLAIFIHVAIVTPILWNIEHFLLLIGQEPIIASLGGTYMRIQIFGVPAAAAVEACKRYLQAQGIMYACTAILIVVAPIIWTVNFFLVRSETYGIGFIGAPIATVLAEWLLLIGLIIYMCNSQASNAWGGWNIRVLGTMFEYYCLAIPAVITVCAEWVAFDLLTIGSSYFGAIQLASNAIMFNSISLVSQISIGLSLSTSPRIGNLIGAGKPRQAQISGDVSVAVSFVISVLGTLFIIVFGDWWISIYTTDPAIAHEAAKLILVACLFLTCNGFNAVGGAILRGLGRQQASAKAFVLGFYLCGAPAAVYLAFKLQMQTAGLWWGICIGVIVTCILQIVYIYRWIDWKKEVLRCITRLRRNSDGCY